MDQRPARVPVLTGRRSPRSAAWFLVQAELVSRRIREGGKCAHPRADIRTRRQDPAACGLNPLQGVRNGIDHYVDPGPFVRSPITLLYPGPADVTGVIEGERAIPASSDLPAENAAVEVRGPFGRLRPAFQTTDLAVRHMVSPTGGCNGASPHALRRACDAAAETGSRISPARPLSANAPVGSGRVLGRRPGSRGPRPEPIMQPEKDQSAEPQRVVGPDLGCGARKYSYRFGQDPDVSGPDRRTGPVHGKVEPGIPEPPAGRGDRECSLRINGRPQQDKPVAAGKREDDLDAGVCMAGDHAGGVAPGVKNVPGAPQLAHPRRERDLTGHGIDQLHHLRSRAVTGVQRIEGHVELLQATTE